MQGKIIHNMRLFMNPVMINNKAGNVSNLSQAAIPVSGLFLHAAAILLSKGVVLLLGHSSSGKSAISSMLSSHFQVVADDIVFAMPREVGEWTIMEGNAIKSKFKGYEHNLLFEDIENEAMKTYPLHSIIRIFAAQNTELGPLPPIKICEYLMDAVFEIDVQRNTINSNLTTRWFQLTAAMASQYTGWQLRFNLDEKKILSLFQKRIV